jgi:hypothetical protein
MIIHFLIWQTFVVSLFISQYMIFWTGITAFLLVDGRIRDEKKIKSLKLRLNL